jgi:hypothetical protein
MGPPLVGKWHLGFAWESQPQCQGYDEWLIENSWVLGPYMKMIEDYRETLKGHPNPPAPNFTDY